MTIPVRELDMAEVERLLERARSGPLSEADCTMMRSSVDTLFYLSDLADNHRTTPARLRAILARWGSEKLSKVFPDKKADEPEPTSDKAETPKPDRRRFVEIAPAFPEDCRDVLSPGPATGFPTAPAGCAVRRLFRL
jgi:hypothetical protein